MELVSDPGLEALSEPAPPKSVIGPSGRAYRSTAFCCLRPHHFPRRQCIWLVESSCFEPIVFFAIVGAVSMLAWASPLDPSGTAKADFIDQCESLFLAIFTVEMALKLVASSSSAPSS